MNNGAPPPSQCSEGTSPVHGQPGYFAGAENIHFAEQVTMNDIRGDYNVYEGRTGLEDLQHSIAASAIHDAFQRSAPRCHCGTREDSLRIINDWINDKNPPKRLLWVYGPVGAGKSAIAQTIAESRAKDKLVASFFFLRNDKECGVADRLFTTLAWQLAKAVPETYPYLQSVLKAEPLLPTKSIGVQFDELFVKVFESLRRDRPDFRSNKSLVVIDGIDECEDEKAQQEILGLIGRALTQHNIPLCFLICSRSEPHIREAFHLETMQNVEREIELPDASADIRRYLKEGFSRIFTKQLMPHPSDEEIDQLVAKSSGQFIFPSTVVKFVDDEDYDARNQLNIVLGLRSSKSSLPFSSLDQLYTQILSRQPDVRLLRDVFVLVIAFGRPSINFICRRLRIKQYDLRRKLRRMHSLLHLSEHVIEIHHLSLHDFFQDKRRACRYYINPWRVRLLRLPRGTPWSQDDLVCVAFAPVWILGVSLVAPFICLYSVVIGCPIVGDDDSSEAGIKQYCGACMGLMCLPLVCLIQ